MRQNKLKTLAVLTMFLASLILPLATFEPASAAPFNFYGGTLPDTYGGVIINGYVTIHWVIASAVEQELWIYVNEGATTVAYLVGTVTYSGVATEVVELTLSGGIDLEAGHTYTLQYVYTPVGGADFWLSDGYAVCTPEYVVSFRVSGLDSSATGTVATVDGVPLTYTQLQTYSEQFIETYPLTFTFASSVASSTPGKSFTYVSANETSPDTITEAKTITGTYTTTGGSTGGDYTIHGPYFEDGSVATGYTANFTLLYLNGTVHSSSITSTGVEGSFSFTTNTTLTQLTWNASTSTTYNSTRVFTYADGINDIDDSDVYLYILNPDKPAYSYTFSITDFYGMINPYLQTAVSADGNTSRPVERANLNEGSGYVTFIMQQYQLYTLTFICQQGTLSRDFTPSLIGTPGQTAVTWSVYAGDFPSANTTSQPTATAVRDTNTITVTYIDPTETTVWAQTVITHKQGTSTINDYTSTNSSGNVQVWTWSLANPTVTYTATVTADIDGETETFILIVPPDSNSNPWDIDWGNLGAYIPTLPTSYTGWGGIDPSQLVAALIILFALGIGSYFSTGVSCLISWILSGVLYMMGWWQGSIPLFGLALFLTVLILIDEYKKGAGYNL